MNGEQMTTTEIFDAAQRSFSRLKRLWNLEAPHLIIDREIDILDKRMRRLAERLGPAWLDEMADRLLRFLAAEDDSETHESRSLNQPGGGREQGANSKPARRS